MFGFTVFVLVLAFVAIKTAVIIPERENGVKERLGKFVGIMEPGLHFLIPFLDRVAYRHEIREQVLEVPSQTCISKDNIQVEVDGIIYIKVTSPQLASYGIENYRLAAVNLAQTTMRSELGKLTLHQSFSERENLNQIVVQEIDKASDSWGIKVLRYEIMNITPSAGVIHALEQAMEAERSRRAEVTLALAEKEAVSIMSEGKKTEAINISEGNKRKRINEAEGQAQHISILAEASAYGLTEVANAISQPFGDKAMQMRLIESYLEKFGKIVKKADVTLVPAELANIKGVFEGLSKVTTTLKP